MRRFLLADMKWTRQGYSVIITRIFSGLYAVSFVLVLMAAIMLQGTSALAQAAGTTQQASDYKKTITERSSKIINTLSLTDSAKYRAAVSLLSGEYLALASIQDEHAAAVSSIKKEALDKEKETAALKAAEEKKSATVVQLHNDFIAHLKALLTDEQVEKVKDGITYRILPITYAAYLDMLPSLTAEQKEKIYGWLTEARELAMDAETSDKKHAVFGKYKGRINNYLSAAGYDMKKEGEAWAKRIQAAKDAKQSQN